MIRNSRGIEIRRILRHVQLGHHCNNQCIPVVKFPRKFLRSFTCAHDSVSISLLSNKSSIPIWLARTLHQHRLYSGRSAQSSHNNDDISRCEYTQAPDSGSIISPMNITEIQEFVSERLECIASRDTDRLRMIDECLLKGNVYIDDMKKQWRADGKPFEIFLRKHDTDNAETAHNKVEMEHKSAYFRSPYSGPEIPTIAESDIHNLLAERHYRRRIQDYETSDQIRNQLESFGAYIDDKNRKWRSKTTNLSSLEHNYTMSRDSGPIKANITEPEIHDMLNEREKCRRLKDFRGAAVIYEKLQKCGVSIDDDMMEWRADGITFSQILRHEYKLASDAGKSIITASKAEIHKLLAKHWSYQRSGKLKKAHETWTQLSNWGVFLDITAMEWRADGIKHNYRLALDAGQNTTKITDTEIHDLLEQRMLHRWRKNFDAADQIQVQLRTNGVYTDEIHKEWRADGKMFHSLNERYRRVHDSGPLRSTWTESTIHLTLTRLWQLRQSGHFDQADLLSDELFHAGVYVNDKKELWRADGKTCNFALMPGAGPFHPKVAMDEHQMHRLLEDSFRLRLRQDFAPASRIHTELYNAGVFVEHDKNLYRADGIRHSYQKSPLAGPDTSTLSLDDIHDLLAQRWQCKLSRDFASADRMFNELYQAGVFVDDLAMEWRADGIYHTYRPHHPPDHHDPKMIIAPAKLTMDEIHALIGKRVRCQKFKDFVQADDILQRLKDARVYMDDQRKEWRVR